MTERLIPSPVFRLEIDHNRIAVVRIRADNHDLNWLSENFTGELHDAIDQVIKHRACGLLFISTRAKNFIQGLEPACLKTKTDRQLHAFSEEAQAVLHRLNTLPVPVIAAIDGHCFGIGLELALACDYRIAGDNHYTQFAMPQVRSGILPFAGGTQRLPRLIGLSDATLLLMSGYKVGTEKALKLGLIDQVVPVSRLADTAYRLLLENKVTKTEHEKQPTLRKKLRNRLENNRFFRRKYLNRTENFVWNKTFGNYPAVDTLLELLREPDFNLGLALERQALVTLFQTETTQVLLALKKTERSMKNRYRLRGNVRDVRQVSVLGSGYMGAGIAYLTAHNARLPVRIKDIHPSEIQKALRMCYELMQAEMDKGILNHGEMLQCMNLITGGERLVAAQSTDFIIEAVFEDLNLKRQMVRESEGYYDEHAIFATNTSTFSVRDIAQAATRPENVIGFHYFSPPVKRKMIEIVPHAGTSEHTVATAIHFAIQQGKIPLLVADKQGFFINRILTPLLLEAIECLIDGEAIEFIDRALQEFGFHLGPLAVIDETGLDVLVKSNPALVRELGDRFALHERVSLLIRNHRKGCKNKRGFYMYDRFGHRIQEDKSIYHVMETIARNELESEEIARRCILRMMNEAAWCLQDGVIRSADEGNVASVLGAGFPAFRGGIYAYIEKIGAPEIVRQLRLHVQKYGKRFEPCEWLVRQAENSL